MKRREASGPTGFRLRQPVAIRPSLEQLEGRALLANAGTLDPTFGAAGLVFTPKGPSQEPEAIGVDAAAGNKIVVAQQTEILAGQEAEPVPIEQVERLNSDGSLDTTFGTNGVVRLTFPGLYIPIGGIGANNPFTRATPAAVFATNTGQIDVLTTVSHNMVTSPQVAITELNPDGSPVAGLGAGGTLVVSTPNVQAVDFRPTSTGFLILADQFALGTGNPPNNAPAVIQVTAAGQLDPSFGVNGVANLTAKTPANQATFQFESEDAVGFGVDGQGRIVVAAQTRPTSNTATLQPTYQAEAFRLTSAGQPDPTFAQTGTEILPTTTLVGPSSVVAQPDGKVVLTGSALSNSGNLTSEVLRLNADGSVDTAHVFDRTTQPLTLDASAIQPDGKILAAGTASPYTIGGPYAVVRLNADLTPDYTFGIANGEATFTDPDQAGGELTSVILDSNNNILVTGSNVSMPLIPLGFGAGGSLVARLLGAATTTAPVPVADLAISELDGTGPATSPGTLTITLTVTNAGPDDATGVVVTDQLPGFVAFLQATPSQGSPAGFSPTSKTLTDALGTVPAGRSATITILVSPSDVGIPPTGPAPDINTASVTSTVTDPDTFNNTLTQSFLIPEPASVDLVLTQTTSSTTARIGQVDLFVVTVTNQGTASVPGVVVQDVFPANAVLLNVAPTQGTVGGIGSGQAFADFGILAPGGSASVIVVVVPTAIGAVVNRAAVATSVPVGNLSNSLSILGLPVVDGPVVQGITRGSNGSSVVVTFDEALDPTSAKQRTNFRVVDLGLRSLHRTTGRNVAVGSVSYTPGAKSVQITTAGRLNSSHEYALILGGSTPKGLLDAGGRRLVGNGSGLSSSAAANLF